MLERIHVPFKMLNYGVVSLLDFEENLTERNYWLS